MPEPLIQNMSQQLSTFKHVQDLVTNQVSRLFVHQGLAREIANSVLISYVEEDNAVNNLQSWISSKIDRHTESYIGQLWQYSFQYALQLVKSRELAEDLAQEAIVALLRSRKPIIYEKAWLKATVFKQAMQCFKNSGRDKEMAKELSSPEASIDVVKDSELESRLGDKEVKRILGKDEYKVFQSIKQHSTLKEFAQEEGISYAKAREQKHRIYTNLKAGYLKKQGWIDSPKILDYRQLANIKRFMDTLLSHAQEGDYSQVFHYADKQVLPSLAVCMADFKEVCAWEIHINPNGTLRLLIMDITDMDAPISVVLTLAVNKANYIRIRDCYLADLIGIIPEEAIGHLPMEKGTCTLTLEQIKAYL